ncbi:hypothetical protein P4S68_09480 [Pseudoalteromonas sp. Hal099]
MSAYNNYNLAFDVQNTSSDSIHVYIVIRKPKRSATKSLSEFTC